MGDHLDGLEAWACRVRGLGTDEVAETAELGAIRRLTYSCFVASQWHTNRQRDVSHSATSGWATKREQVAAGNKLANARKQIGCTAEER